MKVGDVMTTAVVTVGPEDPVLDVMSTLVTSGIGGVPVVDGDGHLIGIVSETDLVARIAYGDRRLRRPLALLNDLAAGFELYWSKKAHGLTAADVMTVPVETAAPAEDLGTAARRMLERGHTRLPVAEDGVLVGIVTREDLLHSFLTAGRRALG